MTGSILTAIVVAYLFANSRLDLQKAKERLATTTPLYEEVDPNHNGFLKDIGTISESIEGGMPKTAHEK
ncbi:unnamed protein product [Nippostrongylus brasiliensis]|uniref:EF-hand domain-containing protein n=1 Tax=Nippostrongylus brasiliensis TaxID=27835 RepID=A0A0N4YRE0_NIPBR|nr:unnamed protein product [Nippostrongylus brasiliensis]